MSKNALQNWQSAIFQEKCRPFDGNGYELHFEFDDPYKFTVNYNKGSHETREALLSLLNQPLSFPLKFFKELTSVKSVDVSEKRNDLFGRTSVEVTLTPADTEFFLTYLPLKKESVYNKDIKLD